jgi:photosystem II stability/assembly factor-like uncharacterized protein
MVVDPTNAQRLWVGISAVGVMRSDDGGKSWQPRNAGLPSFASALGPDAEIGRCVHKLMLDSARPGSLVLQYHGGVFVSDDAGDSWQRISAGLPHDFGFPLAVTTRGEFFVVPLVADTNRVVPDGALKVWRTRDRGRTWRAMTKGLPQKDHFVGVLRDAMTADAGEPAGLFMGTTGGESFYSKDAGASWAKLPASFPRITSVKVWKR